MVRRCWREGEDHGVMLCRHEVPPHFQDYSTQLVYSLMKHRNAHKSSYSSKRQEVKISNCAALDRIKLLWHYYRRGHPINVPECEYPLLTPHRHWCLDMSDPWVTYAWRELFVPRYKCLSSSHCWLTRSHSCLYIIGISDWGVNAGARSFTLTTPPLQTLSAALSIVLLICMFI